ncbi:MAG: serine hydrolase domain-containing protein [Balneolaceae bacterium]
MKVKAIQLALMAICISAVSENASSQSLGQGTADDPINRWSYADPVEMGLDTVALNEHEELCVASAAIGCIVVYKGYIVQEYKSADHDYGPFLGTASATKSITAILVGMLIDDGKIESVEDPVSKYIPEWKAGADSSVTIRHLLTMTAGIDRYRPYQSVLAAYNTTDFVLNLPVPHPVGKYWSYSNEGVQLLSPILEKAAGMPLSAYARERLFEPLGMTRSQFEIDEYYNTITFGGLETTLSDFPKIGQLIANKGQWNGEQILSSDWIDEMSTPIEQNPGYGYLWWLLNNHNAIAAAGDGDRVLIVFPDDELVAVRLQRIASVPGTFTETYFNDRGRMHAKAANILARVLPE